MDLDKSNPDQVKKFLPNHLDNLTAEGNNAVLDSINKHHNKVLHQTESAKIDRRKYQIYCNKQHLLYLTHEEFYRTIVKGHVITTLRIHEFTPFGFDKKTDIGEENE